MNPLSWITGFSPLAYVVVIVSALLGVQTVRLDRAQANLARKDTQIAQLHEQAADQVAKASEERRLVEHAKALAAERIADEQDVRLAASAGRAARAEHAAAGMRDDIAALNARVVPEDPGAAAFAVEARTARELLGSCTDEYQRLAGEADGLRDQVIGLQEFVATVEAGQ